MWQNRPSLSWVLSYPFLNSVGRQAGGRACRRDRPQYFGTGHERLGRRAEAAFEAIWWTGGQRLPRPHRPRRRERKEATRVSRSQPSSHYCIHCVDKYHIILFIIFQLNNCALPTLERRVLSSFVRRYEILEEKTVPLYAPKECAFLSYHCERCQVKRRRNLRGCVCFSLRFFSFEEML